MLYFLLRRCASSNLEKYTFLNRIGEEFEYDEKKNIGKDNGFNDDNIYFSYIYLCS